MALNTDTLLDRTNLKQQLSRWRVLAILSVIVAIVVIAGDVSDITPKGEYIARVVVKGMISEDSYRDEIMEKIYKNDKVAAVIVHVNSPGGTVAAGETLFKQLEKISGKKPVVAVMRSLATSAGYMITLGADHVIASHGSLTGSIGVMLQTVEVTKLAEKVGIKSVTLRSGPMKGQLSPMEKTPKAALDVMQTVIDDYYLRFMDIIIAHRPLTLEELKPLADGRVYTGKQALDYKLVDALGDEQDALNWLQEEHNIDEEMKVRNVSLIKPQSPFAQAFRGIFNLPLLEEAKTLLPPDGLVSIWTPGLNTGQ